MSLLGAAVRVSILWVMSLVVAVTGIEICHRIAASYAPAATTREATASSKSSSRD